MPGTIYIVATPIGNLEDMTLRGIRILGEVDVILAEDTRVTTKLLNHLEAHETKINAKLMSYHQHSSEKKKLEILNMLLQGKNLALVTDAGTPGVSDPGNELVDHLSRNAPEIKTVPIPGASALTTALSVSGMNVNKFVFLGFLPKKKRTNLFRWLKEGRIPFVFYESPKRIKKTLQVIESEFGGGTNVFIARELTKMHETLYRGKVSEVLGKLDKENIRGEIVVTVE